LRPVEDGDLDALFEQARDPAAGWLAAFTPVDQDVRAAFDARMARQRPAAARASRQRQRRLAAGPAQGRVPGRGYRGGLGQRPRRRDRGDTTAAGL